MPTNVIRHVAAGVVAALVVAVVSLLALSGSAHAAGAMVDLSITKTASPEPVDVGADLTYTMVVKNAGPDATTSTVVDTLSPTVTYVSSTPNGECALQGTVLTCNVPNLNAGNKQTIKVIVQPQAPGPLVNVATVSGGPVIDTDPTNNVATVVSTVNGNPPGSVADLQIVKTANPDPATVGERLTYTLTVTNNGPDTVQSQVIDALPLTTTYVSSHPAGECSVQGNVANCAVPALAAGATHVIRIVVTPTAPAPVLNTATVNGGLTTLDTNPTNNISAIITMVNPATPPPTSPSPSPTHSHTPPPSGTPSGGIQTGAGGASGRPIGPMVVGFGALLMLGGTLALRLRGRGRLTR